jgi:4-hydroxy-tetrahydrodipicolinate synthase
LQRRRPGLDDELVERKLERRLAVFVLRRGRIGLLTHCDELAGIHIGGQIEMRDGLRGLDRHVAVMGALASRFHEYKATGMFDGTLSGFWNFALDPMLDHLEAWDRKDIDKAREIWDGGLSQLHEYVADMGRLHIRYKTAAWLRGLIPHPFMRAPMPKPQQVEIDTIYRLLRQLGLSVIDLKETRLAA